MDIASFLQNISWQLTALIGGITSLLTFFLIFREQFAQLLPKLSRFQFGTGKHTFQIEFGQQVRKAKAKAKGVEETVTASRSMPAPNLIRDLMNQPARDIVLAAWGALQQIIYDACTASGIPLTPATRVPEAVRRLGEAHVINAEIASLTNVLYKLGQELANDTGLKPLEDDARGYKELADLVVDWMMLSVLSRGKGQEAKPAEEPKPLRKTVVGGHFPPPQLGYPVAVLVGIGGPMRGQRFSVEKPYYRIGSNADNDLRITGDAYVSGNHAALRYEQGSLFLADQGSRNGSFVNDRRVAGSPVVVRRGDHLRLGESVFQVADEPPK